MKIWIAVVLALSIVAGFIFWKYAPTLTEKSSEEVVGPITLTVWGFESDEVAVRTAIEEYKKHRSDVTINFIKQSNLNYRSRVQTLIAAGQGPDVLVIHNSWVPMFLKTLSLSIMPSEVMNIDEYSKSFYPIAKQSLTSDNKIYGLSRGVDGIVLFYNEDILKAGGVIVPQTWLQFVAAAVRTTVTDQSGNIRSAGAGMGTTTNVDYWSEILGLLFFQEPGASLEQPNTQGGAGVLKFYTDFVRDPAKKSWDANLPSTTAMFAAGNLTFYFAPVSKAIEIKAANPTLNFKTTRVPQLPGKDVGWGSYWAYGVSAGSKYQKAAWEFLNFYTSQESQQQLFGKGLPEVYSRVDLGSLLSDDPIFGAVVTQAPVFKSWYLNSKTQDVGINDEMVANFAQAVEGVSSGQNPLSVLQSTASSVQSILGKYTPSVPQPTQKP